MAKKKTIDNPANNINLVGDMLVSTGNTVPEKKEKTQKSVTPQVTAYSGDSRSPIPMISVHSVGDLLYRRQS